MFVVLGEALLDMVQPAPGTTYDARPGGGPFNIAVGLARLGHPTALLARLSTGGLGRILRDHATANGLDLSACVDTPSQTTLAFASLDDHGRATYDFYVQGTADWGWTPGELATLPPDMRVFHTGSLATVVDPGADVVLDRLERLHATGQVLLSFDPNVRPVLAGDRDAAVRRVERFVAAAHVVKASEEDLEWLYPGLDTVDAARRWAAHGPALVVVTRGAEGCVAVTRVGSVLERRAPAVDLVDTIGAGDAFESGLLSGLVDAGAVDAASVAALPNSALGKALDRAVLVAGMTCERLGADPPTRAEYEACAPVD
ncbi:MAG TPA: carbohydrate kinase [Nocardioidaceae bacterium]|jgi:fructokinase